MSSTLQQVANEVGVSRMTVSSALRGVGRISIETRKRVQEAATAMGYRPNAAARATRNGCFGAIALLSPAAGRGYLPFRFLDALHDSLADHHLHLTLAHLAIDPSGTGVIPKVLRELVVDGLLVNYSRRMPPELENSITRGSAPSIWINNDLPVDVVRPDDREAGERLTRELIAKGYRRIVYVDAEYFTAGNGPSHYSSQHRMDGYRSAMVNAGLRPQVLCPEHLLTRPDAMSYLRQSFDWQQKPEAVLTYTPRQAFAVLQMAERRGIRVPEDLHLATFHEAGLSDEGMPITTIYLPWSVMADQAVDMLTTRIREGARSLPPRVIRYADVDWAKPMMQGH